jgi:hypothetical protein
MESMIARNASGDADICRRKHGGDTASVHAYGRAMRGAARMYAILTDLLAAHPEGLTTKQIAVLIGEENRNRFAPRLSEMCSQGLVYKTGELKQGCHVLKLNRVVTPEELFDEKWIEEPGAVG